MICTNGQATSTQMASRLITVYLKQLRVLRIHPHLFVHTNMTSALLNELENDLLRIRKDLHVAKSVQERIDALDEMEATFNIYQSTLDKLIDLFRNIICTF